MFYMRVKFTVDNKPLKSIEQKAAIIEAGDSSDRLVAVEPYISARTGEIKSLECWKEFLPSQYNFDDFKNTYLRPLKLQDKYTWVPAEPLKEEEAKDINMYLGHYNLAAHDIAE